MGAHQGAVAQPRRDWVILAGAVLGATPLIVALAAAIVAALNSPSGDFFHFWLAGYFNWTGQDPYYSPDWLRGHGTFGAGWITYPVFAYPLPLATLLAPLGLLSLDAAHVVWLAVSVVLMIVALFMVVLRWPVPRFKHYVLPLLAGLGLFRPVWVVMHNGQLSAWLLFVAVVAAMWWDEGRWLRGGLALSLLALKPSLGLPVLGLAGLWLLAARRWRALAGLAAGLAGLYLLGALRDPAWVSKFLDSSRAMLSDTFGYAPSLWGVGGALCGHDLTCTTWLGAALAGALALGAAAYLFVRPARHDPLHVVAVAVVAALLVTPYIWAYDQLLLLLPIAAFLGELMGRGRIYLVNALAFLALDIGAIALLFVAVQTGQDIWSALVPLAVGAALVWPRLRQSVAPTALARRAAAD